MEVTELKLRRIVFALAALAAFVIAMSAGWRP